MYMYIELIELTLYSTSIEDAFTLCHNDVLN